MIGDLLQLVFTNVSHREPRAGRCDGLGNCRQGDLAASFGEGAGRITLTVPVHRDVRRTPEPTLVRHLDSATTLSGHAGTQFDPRSQDRERGTVSSRTNQSQKGAEATVMPSFNAIPSLQSDTALPNRHGPLAALLLALALIGPPAGQSQDMPAAGTDSTASEPSEQPTHVDASNLLPASGPPFAIPMVVSSMAVGGDSVSTTIYVSNYSDAEATVTIRFRGSSGTDLQMPVSTEAVGAGSATVELKASHELAVSARGTGQVSLAPGTPSKTGWAEVTTSSSALLSVSASIVRASSGNQMHFVEVPSTPSYRRAWLVVDTAGGHSTELILVNNSTDGAQPVHLNYRSGDVSCASNVDVPARGSTAVAISTALACAAGTPGTGRLGTVEVNAAGPFTGIATVGPSGPEPTSYSRSLVGLSDLDPVPLEAWTVSDGGVKLEYLTSTNCFSVASAMLVGVSYTAHASRWQARVDAQSEWVDLPGTQKSGQLCAYSPTEPGEYRGVADVSVDQVPGLYSSSNSISIPPDNTRRWLRSGPKLRGGRGERAVRRPQRRVR